MDFDVVIVGGGLVGASLAAALAPSGLSVALLESQAIRPPSADWDARIYAISPGSAAFLAQSGAWQKLDLQRVQSVAQMQVFGDDQSELDFSAYQVGAPELACILENSQLQHALWQTLQTQDNLTLFNPARCASLAWRTDAAYLQLQDGRELRAKLVVGADGNQSWVRQQADIHLAPTPYQQHGVVANFSIEKPHRGTAFQWFQPDGILALLPLPDQLASMVWSVSPARSAELLAMSYEELCAQVAQVAQYSLGALQMVTPPVAFPLQMMSAPNLVKPRLALIGDAAHSVHPLAGQGVNLGFRDARELARALLQRGAQTDCGALNLLRRYERSRREDILSMQLTTYSLKHLFNNTNPMLKRARNLGLAATNQLAPLKKILARHALN
jgi:2-polyprenylphenol 6-hydroxylase